MTRLYSRRENVLKQRLPYIATALQGLPNETVIALRAAKLLQLILWNSLWGEFISIPKEVIGMETTCEDKS
jgi:hypothetical protein